MTRTMLAAVPHGRQRRESRDRLELLTALINGPAFDRTFAGEIIRVPARHPVYPWHCAVIDCERPSCATNDLCAVHAAGWKQARVSGMRKAEFVKTAEPLRLNETVEAVTCRICPERPAFDRGLAICHRHRNRWRNHRRNHGDQANFPEWLLAQTPFPSYGECVTRACDELAASPLGLCTLHVDRYRAAGKPGGAALPGKWFNSFEKVGKPVPVHYEDRPTFARWCATQPPVMRIGEINLRGLNPLVTAEIQWGLHRHGQGDQRRPWELPWIQTVVDYCHRNSIGSLLDIDQNELKGHNSPVIIREIVRELDLVYLSPADTREAGFIETEHFGVRFPRRSSRFDFTAVPQRWLRDLLWDCVAERLRSPQVPRTSHWLDLLRKFCREFGTFLEQDAPGAGHDPAVLRAEHVERFVAEVRRRERLKLPAMALNSKTNGDRAIVTPAIRHTLFNAGRQVLRGALENGEADRIGLERTVITAMPPGGRITPRTRSPFPDDVARAVADETNLRQLADVYDPGDRGLRDMWEAIVATGRRGGEIVNLRLDCIGRYNGLPMLWHDQTKVGRYDEAIRIPEPLYAKLDARRRKTLAWFADRHRGRMPTPDERTVMALFPSGQRNRDGRRSMSMTWFNDRFKRWIDGLEIGHYVAHQARHTLATRLLAHGATLSHIRRYLGHVSDRMAEHYAKVNVSELDDVLHHVWVAGPGATNPGELLTTHLPPMAQGQAEALALDLARRSTPTEGGFCTNQVVVDGGACPWKLNCESCGKFVISGADLLYWQRKREHWNSIAERAPDDATADYLHKVFEPTAKAIDGLERALAGLGLLDDALALDLRRPQDYFQRLWNVGFRVSDLIDTTSQDELTDITSPRQAAVSGTAT